jgi:hypothetical protein
MKANRREFSLLGAATVATALSTSSPLSALALDASQTTGRDVAERPWYRRIKRIGQTNFNERDPQYGDVEKWANF